MKQYKLNNLLLDKNAKDGYGTKWSECDGKVSIEYQKKSIYLLCSYSKV